MLPRIRILVAEDRPDDADLMLLELSRSGLELESKRVETAEEMRAALAAGRWDVVLSDHTMPGFAASAALDLCREADPDLPVIVVSGTIGEERAVELMRAGAADFLVKSSLARLAPAVEREMREAENRRARRRAEGEARQLAAIVSDADYAIISQTLDGIITSWNAGAERLYGYTTEEALGRDVSFLVPSDREDEMFASREAIKRGESRPALDVVRLHKSGHRLDVSVSLSPVRDAGGQVVGISGIGIDISARKRAEVALARDTLLLANVRDAIIVTDPLGVVTYWNDGATRLFGWSLEEMVGRPLIDRYPESARSAMADEIRMWVGGKEWTGEIEDWRKDGSRVWINARVSRISDAAGHVVGVLGLFHDFTNRKRAEEDARRAISLLRAVTDGTPDAVFVKDREGKYLLFNPAASRFVGKPVEEVLGRDDGSLFGQSDARRVMDRDRQVMESGEAETDEEVLTAAGVTRVYQATKGPYRDDHGNVIGVIGISRDITDRKEAERALRDSEERLRVALAAAGAVAFEWDAVADRVVRYYSVEPALPANVGAPETVADVLARVHPDDRDRFVEGVRACLAAGTEYQNLYRVVRPDGTVRWLEEWGTLSRDAAGNAVRLVGISIDITDRKKAEGALRASEARKSAILETALDCIITMDHEGNVVEFNSAAERTFGYRRAEVVGKELAQFIIPPSLRERHRAGMAHYLNTTEGPVLGKRLEFPALRADGTEFPAELAITRIPTDGPPLFTAYLRDITDQMRAQAERAELLARLNLQIERMPLAYLLSGPDFRYTRWNPAAERLFGFSQAEVLGKHPFELIVPEGSFPLVTDIFARLAAGEMDAHGVCENVTQNGRIITCEWHNTPLFGSDGTFLGVLSLAQDITARQEAEQALHLRDRAIQAVVGGLIISDATRPDQPIIYTSPGFERLTGYTGSEVAGRNCRFLQGPETDPQAVAVVRDAIRTARPCDVEFLNYRKDGTPFWNHLQISPVQDDAGRVTHFVGVQSDVTGRRKLENQFRQAQKMEAVGQLAGGVAHDFNNLLTVINGYGELVHNELPPGHPSRELVAEIRKAGERAAGLTRQLLAFSRQAVLDPKVLDPNALIRDIERMLRRLIGEDIELTAKLAPDLGRVKTDPGQLEQAVVNLCVNARDAMPQGGTLTLETRNVELNEAFVVIHPDVRPGPYVMVAVSDTGTGMTPDVQARIFEPFFTTKEQGKGTGLGLAMVFGFVKQSGGHIVVHSEWGRGTTFKLYLPRAWDATLSGKSGVRPPPLLKGTETVLLVEDEAAVRALGRHILVMCGYTVLVAGNGREAIRAANGHAGPLHLLITDVVMPGGMGGRQVAEEIVNRRSETKVLFTSGYMDDAVVRHGVLDEGTHFLQKPFTPVTLAQKVRDVLDGIPGGSDA
jgi:two-component system cell cycle sensor histidine kinase/response regulator CckA